MTKPYQKLRKAVLPVAGFGTRVLPATKVVPKELLPVVDRPALQYVVDEALEAGIEHIVFVTGRNKGAIEDYFDTAFELETSLSKKESKAEILKELLTTTPTAGSMSFVRQQAPLGLGHAIWCARDIIGDEPFAILLPDVLVKAPKSCLAQMVDAYNQVGGNIIAVDEVPMERVSSYGVISHKAGQDISQSLIEMSAMVEKPPREQAPSNLKITGRYILQPEIMTILRDQEAGAGGEIQLTDAMAKMMASQPFHAFKYEGQDYDCGSKLGYFEAIAAYAKDHREIGAQAQEVMKRFSTR